MFSTERFGGGKKKPKKTTILWLIHQVYIELFDLGKCPALTKTQVLSIPKGPVSLL